VVLAAGILGIEMGALILVLGYMNRAEGPHNPEGRQNMERRWFSWLYMYLGSMIVIVFQILTMEYTDRIFQHTGIFYLAMCIVVPAALIGVAVASGNRWGATILAGVYMLFTALLVWILPLFPAQPKLGPVMNPVTHFVPPQFPLLLIVPAIAVDLLRRYFGRRGTNVWIEAVALGAAFFGVFFAAEWLFADFLMTPAAANAFFGTAYRDFGSGADSLEGRNLFYTLETGFTTRLIIAAVVAVMMARVGLAWGNWMKTIKR
jgi:hypothetical protein